MNEKDSAVVVGISKYGSIKPELEGPKKDAMEFYTWLVSATGGAVPKDNVGLVLSSKWHTSTADLNSDIYSFEPTLTRVTAGSSMTSKPVAFLMADLGVTKTHSRPHVSDDNPYSESQFQTLKYRPGFPDRFGCLQDSRAFSQEFFAWYNHQ